MAFIHGKQATVLWGSYALSDYLNEVGITRQVETGETTTFNADGSAKTYVVGLQDATINLQGLFDGDAGSVDEVMSSALGSDSRDPLTFGPGAAAIGGVAYLVDSHTGQYEVSAPVSDVVALALDVQAEAGIQRGVLLAIGAAVSSTGAASSHDSGASSANGGVGHLHVTSNGRDGTIIVRVQHSADGSSWSDLITFSTVSASTTATQRVAVSGTINRYLRASWTVAGSTGSAAVYVALARR